MAEQNYVLRRAWAELEPELREQGYEMVEVEYGRHGAHGLLRIFIDSPNGITVDDCAQVSHFLSPLLDKLDFIGSQYMLEVSSPGIDRPVRKAADFERFVGEAIKVQAVTPVAGRRKFSGVLEGFIDGLVAIECEGQTYHVHIENVKKANLDR